MPFQPQEYQSNSPPPPLIFGEKFLAMSDSTRETVSTLLKLVSLYDLETLDHCQRSAMLAIQVANLIAIPEEEMPALYTGALLHDIGKLAVPEQIILKRGPLTESERTIVEMHPVYAYHLLNSIPELPSVAEIPHLHHEKWDGSGYPCRLRGPAIPVSARLFAIIDVWDALTSPRPYRPAWPAREARLHLLQNAGSHFDPELVPVFLDLSPAPASDPFTSHILPWN